jgi:hypothetical protein
MILSCQKKVEDVDKLVLEVEDIEIDDDLFKNLLKQVLQLKPVSELPPQQLPVETQRRNVELENSVKEVSPTQVAASGEGTEKVPLAGGLLETGHEVSREV